MLGTLVAVLVVIGLAVYLFLVYFFDYLRRKKGAPSIFVDQCESEGRGKRLVREYQKKYGKKGS